MNFLGMGPAELILIFIIALIVFGPGKLPELGQAIGKSVKDFRKMSQEFTRQMNLESMAAELEEQSKAKSAEKTKTKPPARKEPDAQDAPESAAEEPGTADTEAPAQAAPDAQEAPESAAEEPGTADTEDPAQEEPDAQDAPQNMAEGA